MKKRYYLLAAIIIAVVIGKLNSPSDTVDELKVAININEQETYYRTQSLREQFVGKNLSDIRKDYDLGISETLDGTSNKYWLVYFKDVNITMVIIKKTNEVINICSDRDLYLLNDKSIELKKFVGKKYTYDEYLDIINSVKYGQSEVLGETHCLNQNCIEYYPKGNFTTMSFKEFNNEGDFVQLNRIGFGRLTNLAEYNKKDLSEYYLNSN
jgi:hypothetical protein